MKKNLFHSVVFAALLFAGAGHAQAQKGYEVPPISEEHAALAAQVVEQQLTDPDEANKVFTKLFRKVRNNKEALLSVGQYFLDNNVYPCANQCAKQLYTIAADYLPGLMFNGEVCMFRKDYGMAGQKFEEALALDSTYIPALRRNAFVYKNVNPHVAIEYLEKIRRIDANNHSIDRELGDVYYNLDEFDKAVGSYGSYFKNVQQNDSTDIRAAENYLQSLYATQKFMEVSDLVERFAPLDPKDMVFKRMRLFSAVENYEFAKAKEAMAYIANQEYPDSFYLYLDYTYAGNLMKELDDTQAAIAYFEKALQVDSTKLNGYKELASLYASNKETEKSIKTYEHYLRVKGEDKVDLTDLYGLGRLFLSAIQNQAITPEEKATLTSRGDAVCVQMLEKKPDAYQAMLLRAAMHITDGTKPEDTPKQYYAEALKMMEGKEGVESGKLQALRYLAFYAVQKDMLDDARTYTDQIIAIEPENAFAKQIDTYLKGMNK